MALTKTHKRKKSSRMSGRKMGTHGSGARKKNKGSGHRGGIGLAGSGKRADHKKTLILKKYGHGYFGKKGVTSIGTKKNKTNKINLQQIQDNLENLIKKGLAKKTSKGYEINLQKHKILGTSQVEFKDKFFIKAQAASKSAINKVEKAGGEIVLNSSQKKDVKEKEVKSE